MLERNEMFTVAAWSEVRTVFVCSNTEVVKFESHSKHEYLRLFCICALMYVGSCLPKGWSLVQGVLYTGLRNWIAESKIYVDWSFILL
jgi:hypothetical protein